MTSKELECLEKLKHNVQDEIAVHYIGYAYRLKEEVHKYDEDFNTIKQALQRLEAIDNSNTSEALECLEEISKEECLFKSRNTIYMGGEKIDSFTYKHTIGNHFKGIATIKQALIKAQEQEKVLEIVFEKLEEYLAYATNYLQTNCDIEKQKLAAVVLFKGGKWSNGNN